MGKTIAAILIASPCLVGNAQDTANLTCSGNLEFRQNTTEVTRLDIDVRLNLSAGTMQIRGFWGCLTSMNSGASLACIGEMPVSISDASVVYFSSAGKISDDEIFASTRLELNRYSGTMEISGSAHAGPRSGAQWKNTWAAGKLKCVPGYKQF